MDQPRPDEDAAQHEPLALPSRTTPTWEMELLISGATVFSLMQLPNLLDRGYFIGYNLLQDEQAAFLMPLWIYAKVAVVVLVASFVVHLCLRGYWVALVGMDSVYPGGIRWQDMKLGPLARRHGDAGGSMAERIERADNRATRVFGLGFGFAMVMILPAVLVILVLVLGLLANAVLGPGHTILAFVAVLALVLSPLLLATGLDRRFGERLDPAGLPSRAIAGVLRGYTRLGMGRRNNALLGLFVSHEGRTRAMLTGLLVILPVVFLLTLQVAVARGRLPMGALLGLPTADPYSPANAAPAFYGDSGSDRLTVLPLPHIPSRTVQGPYLEVFIPFIPRLHLPAMQAVCPDALEAGRPGAGSSARLECLGRLSALGIDGKPVVAPLFASSDPDTGLPGMLAMVPVGGLAEGPHELGINEPAFGDPGRPRAKRRYRIPFWK